MKKHVKLYFDTCGFDVTDRVNCEVCYKQATDIHHIEPRGMGGTKKEDIIENLMALCRGCHIEYGDKKQWKSMLYRTHRMRLRGKGITFNEQLITELIYKYE